MENISIANFSCSPGSDRWLRGLIEYFCQKFPRQSIVLSVSLVTARGEREREWVFGTQGESQLSQVIGLNNHR